MFNLSDHLRLQKLLSDTIPLLCKNSLGCQLALSVEALIGVTVANEGSASGNEVLMVSFKQAVAACGSVKSYAWSELPASTETVDSDSAALNNEREIGTACNDTRTKMSGNKKYMAYESGWPSNDSRTEGYGSNIPLRASFKRGRKKRKFWQDNSDTVCKRIEAVGKNKCVKIENDFDDDAFRDALQLHETSYGTPEWNEQYGNRESLREASGINGVQYGNQEPLHEDCSINGEQYGNQESLHKTTSTSDVNYGNQESLHDDTSINGEQTDNQESLLEDTCINTEVNSTVSSESSCLAMKGSRQPKVRWPNVCAGARGAKKLVKYQSTPTEGSTGLPHVRLIKNSGPRMCTTPVQSRQSEVYMH